MPCKGAKQQQNNRGSSRGDPQRVQLTTQCVHSTPPPLTATTPDELTRAAQVKRCSTSPLVEGPPSLENNVEKTRMPVTSSAEAESQGFRSASTELPGVQQDMAQHQCSTARETSGTSLAWGSRSSSPCFFDERGSDDTDGLPMGEPRREGAEGTVDAEVLGTHSHSTDSITHDPLLYSSTRHHHMRSQTALPSFQDVSSSRTATTTAAAAAEGDDDDFSSGVRETRESQIRSPLHADATAVFGAYSTQRSRAQEEVEGSSRTMSTPPPPPQTVKSPISACLRARAPAQSISASRMGTTMTTPSQGCGTCSDAEWASPAASICTSAATALHDHEAAAEAATAAVDVAGQLRQKKREALRESIFSIEDTASGSGAALRRSHPLPGRSEEEEEEDGIYHMDGEGRREGRETRGDDRAAATTTGTNSYATTSRSTATALSSISQQVAQDLGTPPSWSQGTYGRRSPSNTGSLESRDLHKCLSTGPYERVCPSQKREDQECSDASVRLGDNKSDRKLEEHDNDDDDATATDLTTGTSTTGRLEHFLGNTGLFALAAPSTAEMRSVSAGLGTLPAVGFNTDPSSYTAAADAAVKQLGPGKGGGHHYDNEKFRGGDTQQMLASAAAPALPPHIPTIAEPHHWSVFYPEGIEVQPPILLHYLTLGSWRTVAGGWDYFSHRRLRKKEILGHSVRWLHNARPRDRFVFIVDPVEAKADTHQTSHLSSETGVGWGGLLGRVKEKLFGTPPAFAYNRGKLVRQAAPDVAESEPNNASQSTTASVGNSHHHHHPGSIHAGLASLRSTSSIATPIDSTPLLVSSSAPSSPNLYYRHYSPHQQQQQSPSFDPQQQMFPIGFTATSPLRTPVTARLFPVNSLAEAMSIWPTTKATSSSPTTAITKQTPMPAPAAMPMKGRARSQSLASALRSLDTTSALYLAPALMKRMEGESAAAAEQKIRRNVGPQQRGNAEGGVTTSTRQRRSESAHTLRTSILWETAADSNEAAAGSPALVSSTDELSTTIFHPGVALRRDEAQVRVAEQEQQHTINNETEEPEEEQSKKRRKQQASKKRRASAQAAAVEAAAARAKRYRATKRGVEVVEVLHENITATDFAPRLTSSRFSIEAKAVYTYFFPTLADAFIYYGCPDTLEQVRGQLRAGITHQVPERNNKEVNSISPEPQPQQPGARTMPPTPINVDLAHTYGENMRQRHGCGSPTSREQSAARTEDLSVGLPIAAAAARKRLSFPRSLPNSPAPTPCLPSPIPAFSLLPGSRHHHQQQQQNVTPLLSTTSETLKTLSRAGSSLYGSSTSFLPTVLDVTELPSQQQQQQQQSLYHAAAGPLAPGAHGTGLGMNQSTCSKASRSFECRPIAMDELSTSRAPSGYPQLSLPYYHYYPSFATTTTAHVGPHVSVLAATANSAAFRVCPIQPVLTSAHFNTVVSIYTSDPNFAAVLREVLIPEPGTHPYTASAQEQRRMLSMYETGMPPWTVFLAASWLPYRRVFRLVYVGLTNLWPVISLAVGLYDLYKHLPQLRKFMAHTLDPFTRWLESRFTLRVSVLVTYLISSILTVFTSLSAFFSQFYVVQFFSLPIFALLFQLIQLPFLLVFETLWTAWSIGYSFLSLLFMTVRVLIIGPFLLVSQLSALQGVGTAIPAAVEGTSLTLKWWKAWQEFWVTVAAPIKNLAKAWWDSVMHVMASASKREASIRRWLAPRMQRVVQGVATLQEVVAVNTRLWLEIARFMGYSKQVVLTAVMLYLYWAVFVDDGSRWRAVGVIDNGTAAKAVVAATSHGMSAHGGKAVPNMETTAIATTTTTTAVSSLIRAGGEERESESYSAYHQQRRRQHVAAVGVWGHMEVVWQDARLTTETFGLELANVMRYLWQYLVMQLCIAWDIVAPCIAFLSRYVPDAVMRLISNSTDFIM